MFGPMSSDTHAAPATRSGWSPARLEAALLALWAVALLLIPIRIGTAYSGLPAHPLLLHVPVILIPVVSVAAVLFAFRPRLSARFGLALAAVGVAALAGTNLTMGAGQALRAQLGLGRGRLLPPRLGDIGLRAVVVALAVGSLFFVVRTGDLGAKAVWQDRLRARVPNGQFPGGPPPQGGGFGQPGTGGATRPQQKAP